MDKIYAELVINSMKPFSKVPKALQEKVKIILQNYVNDEVITQTQLDHLLQQ